MDRQVEIIDLLLKATVRINEAIKHRDIEMVKVTIKQREVLLQEYNEIENPQRNPMMQEVADKILLIDEENNKLLKSLVDKERIKFEKINREKNDAKKRTAAAKKYVSVGTTLSEFSKFNKKT